MNAILTNTHWRPTPKHRQTSQRSISNQLINHLQLIFIPLPALAFISITYEAHGHIRCSGWTLQYVLVKRRLMQVRCKEILQYLFIFERERRFIWDKWPLKCCLSLYSISQNKSQLLSSVCHFYYPNWLFFLSELTKQQYVDRTADTGRTCLMWWWSCWKCYIWHCNSWWITFTLYSTVIFFCGRNL